MTKIFLTYRYNVLFAQYVPKLIEGLDIVETFVVPQGVALEEVREAGVAAADRALAAGATMILTDTTCDTLGSAQGPNDRYPQPRFAKRKSLDYLFQRSITDRAPQNTVQENFVWFANQVVSGQPVKTVIVVESELGDHRFVGSDESKMYSEERARWAADVLAGVFTGSTVQTVATLKDALEYAADPETLLVMDRHCGIKEVMAGEGWYHSLNNWHYSSMLYLLPFETCAATLVNRGGFDFAFDFEGMRQEILKSNA